MALFKDTMEQKNFWKWVNKMFTPTPDGKWKCITTNEVIPIEVIGKQYLSDFLSNLKIK